MPNSLTSTGLVLASRSELLTNMTASMQTAYGADINLSSDSPDGQALNIFVQAIGDVQDLLQAVYSSFDPDQAIGTALDSRVSINGLVRQAGTYSTTYVSITTARAVTLYGVDQTLQTPYTVADSAGTQWVLLTTTPINGAGTVSLLFRAVNIGAVLTTVGAITVPVTIVLGVTAVINNATYVTLGINAESDSALRIRRQGSTSLSAIGYSDSLRAALKNITGMSSSFVYENNTSATDGNGVPPKSIWVITSGTAANADIANAIYRKRGGGVFMKGAVQYNVTQSDGTLFPVFWDVVTQVPVVVRFTATSIDGINQPNVAYILTQLPTILIPSVAASMNTNTLIAAVQSIDPNCLVTNAGFSTSLNGTFTPTLAPATKNIQFTVLSSNIVITPIAVVPPSLSIGRGSSRQFTASGGVGNKSFSFQTNASGGTITTAGLYTAGSTIGTDVIQAIDQATSVNVTAVTIAVN